MPAVALHQPAPRPRIGFAGVGWIGLNRLRALAADGVADLLCVTDASTEAAREAIRVCGEGVARICGSFEELLAQDLDGIVIATPSGLHAQQTIAALARGRAVFCQKPLARTADEAAQAVRCARERNRLLGVDFSYRTVAGVPAMAELVRSGALGDVYTVDLVFHNAYGPDKPWFYDIRQSGGGCVMDLGIHLVDLLLWILEYPPIEAVSSRLYANGKRLTQPTRELEDHAQAEITLGEGRGARLACSWRLSAGTDAIIEAAFYGTRGSAILRNVGGSFYDFTVEHCEGTSRRVLAEGPDNWGGRAACAWARQLVIDPSFDGASEHFVEVSAVLDAIYGRS